MRRERSELESERKRGLPVSDSLAIEIPIFKVTPIGTEGVHVSRRGYPDSHIRGSSRKGEMINMSKREYCYFYEGSLFNTTQTNTISNKLLTCHA